MHNQSEFSLPNPRPIVNEYSPLAALQYLCTQPFCVSHRYQLSDARQAAVIPGPTDLDSSCCRARATLKTGVACSRRQLARHCVVCRAQLTSSSVLVPLHFPRSLPSSSPTLARLPQPRRGHALPRTRSLATLPAGLKCECRFLAPGLSWAFI